MVRDMWLFFDSECEDKRSPLHPFIFLKNIKQSLKLRGDHLK
ncbi:MULTISPECIES: hypothetical protein [Nostocaceae]|nr:MULTISPECIES: hypothetical protein [Nostocaceae]